MNLVQLFRFQNSDLIVNRVKVLLLKLLVCYFEIKKKKKRFSSSVAKKHCNEFEFNRKILTVSTIELHI